MTHCTVVHLSTSEGEIGIELYQEDAPRACENFKTLAERGYYDGTVFHRLVKGFVLQGGDPTGTGTGGESCFGGLFGDELSGRLKHTGAGVVSCASAGPNLNGSQFFITLAPAPSLDGTATIFGRVYSGMSVLRRISEFKVGSDDRPLTEVRILRAVVAQKPRQSRPQQDTIPLPSKPAQDTSLGSVAAKKKKSALSLIE